MTLTVKRQKLSGVSRVLRDLSVLVLVTLMVRRRSNQVKSLQSTE